MAGHVQVRACGGAYRPEQSGCPVRPMTGITIRFQLAGSSAASNVTTDATGFYRIELEPGIYNVQLAGDSSSVKRELAGPRTITVDAGKTVTADFIDTIELM